MERTKQKSHTQIFKKESSPQSNNYIPLKTGEEINVNRYQNESFNLLSSSNIQERSRKETFQQDNDSRSNKYTPKSQQPQNRIINPLSLTPVGSQKNININILKKQSTIGNIFQVNPKSMNNNINGDKSPLRNTKNIFYKSNENNMRISEQFNGPSQEKIQLPSLNNLNKSGLLKTGVQSHLSNNNILQNNESTNASQAKGHILNSTQNSNSRILMKQKTLINSKSIAQFQNGTSGTRAISMHFNPDQFSIQKSPINSSNLGNKIMESQSHQQSPNFGPVNPIKLDLRESLKSGLRRSMNDLSPIRQPQVDINENKNDQYVSARHSSLVNFEEESKTPKKKIISMNTSNAMLPLSLVNQMKVQKMPISKQEIQQDNSPSPLSRSKLNLNYGTNGIGMTQIERLILQQKQDSLHSEESSSRYGSKRTIKDFKDTFDKMSNFNQDNSNLLTNASFQSPILQKDELQDSQYNRFTYVEQTQEQKTFQKDLIQRIRHKQKTRFTQKIQSLQEKINDEEEDLGFKSKDSGDSTGRQAKKNLKVAKSIFEKALDTKQIVDEDTSTQNRAQKVFQISEDFNKLLRNEIGRSTTQLSKSFFFFLEDVNPKIFIEGVVFLFQNALTISLTNNYDVKKRKYNYKIPQKFFELIQKVFRERLLQERYKFNEAYIERFEFLLEQQYEEQQLKPSNLLEELGGAKKCQFLIQEFSQMVQSRLEVREQMSEKQIQDIGIAFLTDNEEGINNFLNNLKRTKRILDSDLFCVKHALYHYLYVEKNSFFDDEIKQSFLYAFERIRYKYFTTFLQVDTDQVSRDILKYFLTKKPILEYFGEEQSQERAHFFIIQIINCFMFQEKTSSVSTWLKSSTLKKIDESFFLMLEPLFIEPFKRLKLGQVFTRNSEMKFQWLKIGCNIFSGVDQVLERMDELLLNMKNWVDGMIQQKQLNKQQLSKINQIQNVLFLKYFIHNALTPDLYNNNDIYFMMNTFQTSQDAVLFQLKGLKRTLLHMRFKPQESYEIAEYLIKTFNESFHCQAPPQ